jgi:hypothetical protein
VTQTAAVAQAAAPIDALYRALGLPQIIEIMREEGLVYGASIEEELFASRGGARWKALVDDIYDAERMNATVRNRLDSELAAADLAPMIAFFETERGHRIVELEVSARRALLDESVEAASREALAAMIDDNDPRVTMLFDFADAGELVESNVVGAMNASYAFYLGLSEADAFAGGLSEDDILADVWGQESDIRFETEEWLYSYLALAYRPLSDEELQAYTDFFLTPEGAVLNRAIFNAFDEMFVAISLALGQGASRYLGGQEL